MPVTSPTTRNNKDSRKSRSGPLGFLYLPKSPRTPVALPKTYLSPAAAEAATSTGRRKMRLLGLHDETRRFYKLLAALILCSTVVSMVLLSRLWKVGHGTSGGFAGFLAANIRTTLDPFEEEFRGQDRMPPSIESQEKTKSSHTGDALLDYYALITSGDGKEISWYTEVNNRASLLTAMKDYLAMMLEADVQVRWDDVTKQKNGTAVISAKPIIPADITLADWLSIVARYSNKGVKLNFGSAKTLIYGMPVLSNLISSLHAPLWVHADILPGPNGESTVPVSPEDFIKLTTSSFLPKMTLSVGWTTAWNPDLVQQGYTWKNVIAMARVCRSIHVPVSFSVRAVFSSRSTSQLKWLLGLSEGFTVTLWVDKDDIVSTPELVNFRKTVEAKKVFYKIPSDVLNSLEEVVPNSLTVGKTDANKPAWNRSFWEPVFINGKPSALLGDEHVVLDGAGSWLLSKAQHKPEMKKSRTTVIRGKVRFVDVASPPQYRWFDVYIRNSGVNPTDLDQVQGVRLRISGDGTLTLAPINLAQADPFKLQSTAKLPVSECYEFQLVDKGDGFPLYCTVKLWQCSPTKVTDTDHATGVDLHVNVAYETKQQFYVALTGGNDQLAVLLEQLSVSDRTWA